MGTRSDVQSPFGKFLADLGVDFPRSLSLERMVQQGWIKPILRVPLPRAAFDAWTNFPVTSPMTASECPEEAKWALDVYVRAVSSGWPRSKTHWWIHDFDDASAPISETIRTHAADPGARISEPFRHARCNQEVRPWIDYFAYWQAFEIAEFRSQVTSEYLLTDEVPTDPESVNKRRAERVELVHQQLQGRWVDRYRVFDWLSRMRTVLGSMQSEHSWHDVDTALRAVMDDLTLSPDQIRSDIRDVLLIMWREWTGRFSRLTCRGKQILDLLRQEIEYSVFYLERLTGQTTDFLDEFWHDAHQVHEWACLIDALPREEELARRDFPRTALMYLERYQNTIPQIGALDDDALRRLISENWQKNRPLRRFVLACHRLHRELRGQDLMESEAIIRRAERIEQFNLMIMHAERVLSYEYRERQQSSKYPEVRKLAKDTLNHLLGRWSLTGDVSRIAQQRTKELLKQHAMLHDLDPAQGLPLVSPSDVASGSDAADHSAAMLINFVIARNYAAHHDAVDANLVYPSDEDPLKHPGGIATTSAIGAVVAALLTR